MNDFLQSLRNGQAEKSRTPKTRKSYDNSYQYSGNPRFNSYNSGYQNQRNPNMKRQPVQPQNLPMGNQVPQEDSNIALLADAIENLTSHIETLVKTQEYMANIQERTSETLERQAIAIEQLVKHMHLGEFQKPMFDNHYVSSQEEVFDDMDEPAHADTDSAPQEMAPKSPRAIIRKRKKIVDKEPSMAAAIPGDGKLLSRETIMDIIAGMREEGATFDHVAKHLSDLGPPTFSCRGEWHAQTIHRLCSKK